MVPVQVLPKRAESERETRADCVHCDARFLTGVYSEI